MPTLQASNNPGSRVEVGDTVLTRAKSVSTTAIKARLVKFSSAHKAYKSAEIAVRRAEAAHLAAENAVAEADVVQDAAVDALASAMAGEGAPRTRPFEPIGFAPPSQIKEIAAEKEAVLCGKLAKAASAWKGANAKTKAAAKTLAAAAAHVTKQSKTVTPLAKKKTEAITYRDSLGRAWAKGFTSLKRGALAAEDDGAPGLFEALFHDDQRPAARKPAKQAKAPAPAPSPNGAPPANP